MENRDIFIAESSKGRHIPSSKELNITLMSFTFMVSFQSYLTPTVDIARQTYIKVSNPRAFMIIGEEYAKDILNIDYNGEIVSLIADMHKERGKCNIFLGQDDDVAGNLMAAVLRIHLLNLGVEDTYIIRMPLMARGYDYMMLKMSSFYDNEQLLAIINAKARELVKMNGKGRVGMNFRSGYRNDFALFHIVDKMKELNPTVKKLSSGVGSAVYITKSVLEERG